MDATGVALVTGVGRREGIGAAVSLALARQGYDVAVTWWGPYDARVHGVTTVSFHDEVVAQIEQFGRRGAALEVDLALVESAPLLFDEVERVLGPVSVVVLSHCESVPAGILDTTVESFDRHVAVNARASWLMMREFARRFRGPFASGRIISLTSDHTVTNLAYGASKGALDRITIAAAREFAHLGITANAINPGPTDTGWMTDQERHDLAAAAPWGRLGTPEDCARLVAFLCSDEGQWINGQLIASDGGASS